MGRLKYGTRPGFLLFIYLFIFALNSESSYVGKEYNFTKYNTLLLV